MTTHEHRLPRDGRDAENDPARRDDASSRSLSDDSSPPRGGDESNAPAPGVETSCARVAPSRFAAHAAAVVAFYASVFTLFFSPVLFSSRILAPGDGSNFHAPFYYAGRTLWQPLLWGGYPLAADPQTMTFYPVALLFSLAPRSYDAFVVSAYVLAASFAYAYARLLTRSAFAALACGLAYGMCGFLSAQLGHVSLVHTAAWAPAIFCALEGLRRRASGLWFAASAAAVACAALAGHFQIFTYTLGLAALYTLALSPLGDAHERPSDADARRRRPALARRLRRVLLMLSSLALGVAASAVQLVPTYELTAQGQRARMSFAEFVSFSLPPRHLPRLFFPYAYGGSPASFYAVPYFDLWGPPVGGWGATELALYVGVLPLALATVGLCARRHTRVAWFWAAAAVLALALSAGDALPLARLVFHLPAYDKFRVPARHLFELALAVSTLAGLGVASIERRLADARLVRRAIIAAGCALALSLAALFLLTDGLRAEAARAGVARLSFAPWRNPATLVPLVVFALGASALLFWSRRTASRARAALVVAALACDLASFGWFYEWRYTSPAASSLAPPAAVARYAQTLRDSHQRLLPAAGALTPRAGSPPNVSALWRVPSASGYSALILARTARLLDMTNDGAVANGWRDGDDRSLDLFAVRYVAAPRAEGRDGSQQSGSLPNDSRPGSSAGDGLRQIVSQGVAWDAADLGVGLGHGCGAARPDAAEFTLRTPARADAVALVTALACSASIRDGAEVLRVTLTDDEGRAQTRTLRAGADTSEWAHDCADVLPSISHGRAQVFESFTVERAGARCEGHSYVARARFDGALRVRRLRLEWIGGAGSIDVKKISLLDDSSTRAAPVRPSERDADPARWRRVEDARLPEGARGVGGVGGGVGDEGDADGTGVVDLYENLRARPRAWLVNEVLTAAAEDALKAIKTGRLADGREFDPARTALVEESFRPAPSAQAGAPDAVSIARESDTALGLDVSASADSFLVLSDVNYPGWRARVDGREAHVFQTDYALRGLFVPAGRHAVEFTYEPRSVRAGAWLSATAFAAIAFISLVIARRGRRRIASVSRAGA